MNYKQQLHALTRAVIDGDAADVLTKIKPARHNEFSPSERLAVYRNAYAIRLESAVYVDYPAFVRYVGEGPAREIIAKFVQETNSKNWDLNLYPIGFATFLKTQNFQPEAVAIATLESAIIKAFWGKELVSENISDAQNMSLQQLASQAFDLNPHSKLLSLDYAANAYIKAMRAGENPKLVANMPEYFCVIRHENEVKRVALTFAAYLLLSLMDRAKSFEEALLEAAAHPDVDENDLIAQLPEIMQTYLSHNMLIPKSICT